MVCAQTSEETQGEDEEGHGMEWNEDNVESCSEWFGDRTRLLENPRNELPPLGESGELSVP